MADTKRAEKEYLARIGSADWERVKPFSSPGADTLSESARLLHDFSIAMLALQPQPADRILDLGAGGCWVSDLLGRLNRSTVAVDISVDMLRAGRSRPTGARIPAVAGDMERLPFRAGAFDKAVCLSALHHVPDIPATLREIARVLTDDGIAFFSEPGRGHADAPVSTAAVRDFGVLEQEILIDDFARWCADAGFRDVRIKPMSYAIPEFDLRVDEWERWSRLARSKRPVRALGTLRRGLLEFFGLGKKTTLFEQTTTMSLVRLLRGAVENHPMIVVSKSDAHRAAGSPPQGMAGRDQGRVDSLARASGHPRAHSPAAHQRRNQTLAVVGSGTSEDRRPAARSRRTPARPRLSPRAAAESRRATRSRGGELRLPCPIRTRPVSVEVGPRRRGPHLVRGQGIDDVGRDPRY
jgi:ubiquinone/menaquinone biosynthesis C-methylase UbiE